MTSVFQELGLRYEDQIVIYDQGAAPFAPRAWWMLTYAGFPNVVIVNGGSIGIGNESAIYKRRRKIPTNNH
ncbi:rhodanese-like domain-containing protein [Lysinibacillus sp. MHQ-1]|nr:rhodanese-like domain-containing protein [Lysinibacillus sp. MHQ-1]